MNKAVYEFEGVFLTHVNPQTSEVRRGKSVKVLVVELTYSYHVRVAIYGETVYDMHSDNRLII